MNAVWNYLNRDIKDHFDVRATPEQLAKQKEQGQALVQAGCAIVLSAVLLGLVGLVLLIAAL